MQETIEQKKQEFVSVFKDKIKRTGSEELLNWLEDPAQSDFFIAPASSRYHSSFEGGLLTHSLNVYHELQKLIEQNSLGDTYSEETVAIVSLLHDLCKVNYYVKGTKNVKKNGVWEQVDVYNVDEKYPFGHGEKSVFIIQNFMSLSGVEAQAIRAHMGGFDTSVKGGEYFIGRIFEKNPLAFLTHVADMNSTYMLENK